MNKSLAILGLRMLLVAIIAAGAAPWAMAAQRVQDSAGSAQELSSRASYATVSACLMSRSGPDELAAADRRPDQDGAPLGTVVNPGRHEKAGLPPTTCHSCAPADPADHSLISLHSQLTV